MKKDGTLANVACPPIISNYNCYTGGVDKNDQMKSHYGINVSGKKWWTRVFFDLIDRSIFNSKVLYDESLHTTRKSLKVSKLICQSSRLCSYGAGSPEATNIWPRAKIILDLLLLVS